MDAALTMLFGTVIGVLLVGCGLVLFARSRLRRRLRVSPRVPSGAPLRWLVVPLPAARLHRRLQGAVRAVRAATRVATRIPGRSRLPATAAARLGADLEREAVAIDRRLVAAANLGVAERRRALAATAAEIATLEELAGRVADLARDERERPMLHGGDTALDDLAGRVERLEQARAELTVIEAEARLTVPPGLTA